jgi:hypothetical protein
VCCEIVGPEIRFHFHDPAHALDTLGAMNEALAEQLVGNENGIAIVESARKLVHYAPAARVARAVRNVME